MKINYLFLGLLLLSGILMSFLQGNPEGSGVYMNANDYKNGKLNLQVDCNSEKHKIKLHEFLNKSYIDVKHEGKDYRYQKSEIYGIRDCKGNDYRFIGKDDYKILESKSITLYEKSYLESNPSEKLPQKVDKYYFSTKPDSEALPLTIDNVKKSFPDQHTFHHQMDMYFKSDEDLKQYDTSIKMYKINSILAENKL